MEHEEVSTRRGWLGLIPALVVLGYGIWVVGTALAHGALAWGMLGDYSMFQYVLILGLLCSGYVTLACRRPSSLGSAFLLLFFGYGMALQSVQPAHVPPELRWMFDFIGWTTGLAVIAAGMVLEQQWRARRMRSAPPSTDN